MSTTALHELDRVDPFVGLRDLVLAHVGDCDQARDHARYADGVVLRGPNAFFTSRTLTDTIRVLDPEYYVSDRSRRNQLRLLPHSAEESVRAQLEAGADVLLAPSRFPIGSDRRTIAELLEQGELFVSTARELAPWLAAFVPVVIRFDELADGRWVEPIRSSKLPIATVFAAWGDALSTPAQLEGAIRIIEAARVAFVMRCDMSAAGLMALGAIAAAIGTSSAMRHLYLPSKHTGKRPFERSIFVPRTMSWMKVSVVDRFAVVPDAGGIFACDCPECSPDGDMRHLLESDDAKQDMHSLASAVALTHEVAEAPDPVMRWLQTCRSADDAYSELAARRRLGVTKPPMLNAWLSVLSD